MSNCHQHLLLEAELFTVQFCCYSKVLPKLIYLFLRFHFFLVRLVSLASLLLFFLIHTICLPFLLIHTSCFLHSCHTLSLSLPFMLSSHLFFLSIFLQFFSLFCTCSIFMLTCVLNLCHPLSCWFQCSSLAHVFFWYFRPCLCRLIRLVCCSFTHMARYRSASWIWAIAAYVVLVRLR